MKSKFLKNVLLTAAAVTFISSGTAFAEKIVNQEAHYDNFIFKVNGATQYISDIAKKPFIANFRTYIPISTLNDLGICTAEWTPPTVKGQLGEVKVSPATSTSTDVTLLMNYKAQVDLLTKNNEEKDKKIKELEDKIKKLETAKKEKEEEKLSDRELRRRAADIEYDVNRSNKYNSIKINGNYHDVVYDFDYRRNFDATVYIKGLNDNRGKDRDYLKDHRRILENLLDDVAYKITDDKYFKRSDINFRIIDRDDRDYEIFTYDYRDGRLR